MSTIRDSEVIIVGGGAVGLGCAYALAKAGKRDILLLERAEDVALATTSQGAGLCGQARDTTERIKLAIHSVSVFRELQKTEVKPDWHEVGSLRIALNEKRAVEFKALERAAAGAGLDAQLITNAEAARHWPLMDFSSAKAVLWCPSDGWMSPRSVAKSYAHACRQMGVQISCSTLVNKIVVREDRVQGIETDRGNASCRYLVNAAGAHAHHVARLAGLELPIVPVRHEYFITMPMENLAPELPCFRIPEMTLYGRVRDGGLLLGGWEPKSLHLDPRDYPLEGMPAPVETDWPVLNGFERDFCRLLPSAEAQPKSFIGKGWPTFTPDGKFIIGESSRVKGFVMAGGCNAHGISGSGGIGKLLVEALLEPSPSAYARSLTPDRFTEAAWTWATARAEAARVYETYYGV